MKNKKGLLVFSSFLAISLLAGCGGGGYVKPTTKQEKVATAFKGVESSLKNQRGKNNRNRFIDERVNEIDALTIIYKDMNDEGETTNPDFKYDEPPMIQFQYLKALYEESGNNFSFNTKYTYKLTGDIYYDFDINEEVHDEKYKYHYDFDFSILLNIDNNDLITAEVLFDITYTQNEEDHHQYHYAQLELDYDMDEESPTYVLLMKDYTDLLEDDLYNNVEYDYVDVDKGSIVEWRKFGICAPTSIKGYASEDYVYKFSVLRGYKDLHKYHRQKNTKNHEVKNALIEGFNLDAFVDKYIPFKNQSGTENSAIKTVVDKFNTIYGKDFVYHLAYSGKNEEYPDKEDEPEYQNLNLRIEYGNDDYEITIKDGVGDFVFKDLFKQDNGDLPDLVINLYSGGDVLVETITDYSRLDFTLQTYDHSSSYTRTDVIKVDLNSNKKFSSYLKESGYANFYSDQLSMRLMVSINDVENVQNAEKGIVLVDEPTCKELSSDWSLVEKYFNAYLLLPNTLPAFESKGVMFYPMVYGDGLECGVNMEGENAHYYIDTYSEMLVNQLGYVFNSREGTYTNRVNDDYVLSIRVGEQSIGYKFIEKAIQEGTITDKIKEYIDNDEIDLPDFPGNYEFELREENQIYIVDNVESSLIGDYIASLSEYGFVIGDMEAYRYYDGVFYRICQLGNKIIAVYKLEGYVSLVGDFTSWTETDPNNDLTELHYWNSRYYFQVDAHIEIGQAFKIVKNHSWNDGGYGFDKLNSPESMMYFQPGEYQNIVALQTIDCTIKVMIYLSAIFEDMSQNIFDIIDIEIEVAHQ